MSGKMALMVWILVPQKQRQMCKHVQTAFLKSCKEFCRNLRSIDCNEHVQVQELQSKQTEYVNYVHNSMVPGPVRLLGNLWPERPLQLEELPRRRVPVVQLQCDLKSNWTGCLPIPGTPSLYIILLYMMYSYYMLIITLDEFIWFQCSSFPKNISADRWETVGKS